MQVYKTAFSDVDDPKSYFKMKETDEVIVKTNSKVKLEFVSFGPNWININLNNVKIIIIIQMELLL
jgi:hypothetical protein